MLQRCSSQCTSVSSQLINTRWSVTNAWISLSVARPCTSHLWSSTALASILTNLVTKTRCVSIYVRWWSNSPFPSAITFQQWSQAGAPTSVTNPCTIFITWRHSSCPKQGPSGMSPVLNRPYRFKLQWKTTQWDYQKTGPVHRHVMLPEVLQHLQQCCTAVLAINSTAFDRFRHLFYSNGPTESFSRLITSFLSAKRSCSCSRDRQKRGTESQCMSNQHLACDKTLHILFGLLRSSLNKYFNESHIPNQRVRGPDICSDTCKPSKRTGDWELKA